MKADPKMHVELTERESDIIVSCLLDRIKEMRETSSLFLEFPETYENIINNITEISTLRNKMIYTVNHIIEE